VLSSSAIERLVSAGRRVMVRMGLRAASPPASAADDDGSGSGGEEGPAPGERTCRDDRAPPRRYRSAGGRRPVGPGFSAAASSRRFDSMHEIAGNLAAGVQRIGFHCTLPWTRSRRRRAAERSTTERTTHQVVDGTAMSDEEQRARACEQILQLTEEQIVGTNTAFIIIDIFRVA